MDIILNTRLFNHSQLFGYNINTTGLIEIKAYKFKEGKFNGGKTLEKKVTHESCQVYYDYKNTRSYFLYY